MKNLVILLCVICPVIGKGQFIIRGIVKDSAKGTPIQQASVVIKDSKIGAATKEDGTFRLTVPAEYNKSVKLWVSSLGYHWKEIRVSADDASELKVLLTVDAKDEYEDMHVVVKSRGWRHLFRQRKIADERSEVSSNKEYKITGVVKDARSGQPLAQVTVFIIDPKGKATDLRTLTEANGSFSITTSIIGSKGLKLRTSFIGYQPKEINVSNEQLKLGMPFEISIKAD